MYRYILFDWDGCLANSLQNWFKTCGNIFKKYGYVLEKDEICSRFYKDFNGMFGLKIKEKKRFKMDYTKDVKRWMPNIDLNPGAREILENLKKKGKKIAIVTSSNRDAVESAINNLKIKKYIDLILGLEDVKNPKPNSEIVEKAIKLLDAKKKETIIIGDSYNDIEAGKRAGIATILYYNLSNKNIYHLSNSQLHEADYLISNFLQLSDIMK